MEIEAATVYLAEINDALYTDFWTVTKNSLDYALESHGLHENLELKERLLALYWELQPYPEVSSILKNLKAKGIKTAILSNGSPEMLNSAVKSSNLSESLMKLYQ